MLELKDFFHLPEVDDLVARLAAEGPGLVVVAGLDPRPQAQGAAPQPGHAFLPSGRATFFGILARQVLVAQDSGQRVIVACDKDSFRLPDDLRRRVHWLLTEGPEGYAGQLDAALRLRPDVLVVDQLNRTTLGPALVAARSGSRVIAQLDCVFSGGAIARHLADLGATSEDLASLTWMVTVQRVPALCPTCRYEASLPAEQQSAYRARYPALALAGPVYRAGACAACNGSGRTGDLAAFDFFRAAVPPPEIFEQRSLFSMEEYLLRLALLGRMGVDDLLRFETDQLHRTYSLLTASEEALNRANAELKQRLAQLEASNRVLQQRTTSLISLQEVAQTLITAVELEELAERINHQARELCGADRSILYVLRPDATAEVLAVDGWDRKLMHRRIEALTVFGGAGSGRPDPAPFSGWPPGIPPRHPDVEGAELRAGLSVPLIAQQEVVGLMIVHSTHKDRYQQGEVALLHALAHQAAVAIQRAGLVDSLRDKIARLEVAQAELIRKERLERELELAREVQQSLLPRVFPQIPSYTFAARSEPARQVGGDFYDAFRLDEHRFGIAIADVSDKGMPAALFMALTRSLLLAEARRASSPRAALNQVNRLLFELGDPNMFVTVFYGVVDTETRTLTYVRAGHEAPLLVRGGNVQTLPGKGSFLGLLGLEELPLSEEQIALAPGDRLVLFTDGLIDALSPDDEPFGYDRLEQLVASHADLSAPDFCAAAFDTLTAYQGQHEQYDDMAMMVLSVG
jgi:serine phosphatase RsbU (regulator of sigma subunit)